MNVTYLYRGIHIVNGGVVAHITSSFLSVFVDDMLVVKHHGDVDPRTLHVTYDGDLSIGLGAGTRISLGWMNTADYSEFKSRVIKHLA